MTIGWVGTDFVWLETVTSDGLLCARLWDCGFPKYGVLIE